MLYFLQDFGALDIWAIIGKAGGAVGLLLAIAVYVLWKDNKSKEIEIAKLNDRAQTDAKESIRVMTSLESLMDELAGSLDRLETRFTAIVKEEVSSIKEVIHGYKEKITKRASRADK